jgi:RHS repeat-associated protein
MGTTAYTASYDVWGNLTNRTYSSSSGVPVYDIANQMIRWSSTTTSTAKEEWYLYDASGNRVMRRSASTTSTGNPATAAATITVYPFGLEEHTYNYTGSGSSLTTTGNTYYYSLGGRLIGSSNGSSTTFYLTDLLGSVVSTMSNTAGSAAVVGNQVYGPYGNQRYSAGSLGTAKGFTGQYNDAATGLDYYNARYYDPVVGRFTSADTVQGNVQGMDPYAYVGGNPETMNDPTGHDDWWADPGWDSSPSTSGTALVGDDWWNDPGMTTPSYDSCGCPPTYSDPPLPPLPEPGKTPKKFTSPVPAPVPAPSADPYWHTVRQYIQQNGWEAGYSIISQYLIEASKQGWWNGKDANSRAARGQMQRYLAYILAVMVSVYRISAHINTNADLALGVFWVVNKDGSLGTVGFAGAPGKDSPAIGSNYHESDEAVNISHSEARIVSNMQRIILPNMVKNKVLGEGQDLHLMIYSEIRACDNCKTGGNGNGYPQWQEQLQEVAGGANVHIHAWEPVASRTVPLDPGQLIVIPTN